MRFQPSATRVFPVSKEQGSGGAGGGAGGFQSGSLAVGAEGALADVGHRRLPLEFRNLEGAGHHAVTAADTAAVIVDHRSRIQLDKRRHRAGGDAGGVITVHALAFDEMPGHLTLGIIVFPKDNPGKILAA